MNHFQPGDPVAVHFDNDPPAWGRFLRASGSLAAVEVRDCDGRGRTTWLVDYWRVRRADKAAATIRPCPVPNPSPSST